MPSVACEQVIATDTRQQYLDAIFACGTGQQQCLYRGKIRRGFVELPDHIGQSGDQVGIGRHLYQLHTEVLRDGTRMGLVVAKIIGA